MNYLESKIYYPMLEEGEDIFSQTSFSRWDKYQQIEKKRQNALTHKQTLEDIHHFSQKINLSDTQIRNLTRMIRDFGLYEINRETLYQLIQKHFSLSQEQKNQIFQFIQDVFTKPLPSDSSKESSVDEAPNPEHTPPTDTQTVSPSQGKGYSIIPPEDPNHREFPLLDALSRFPKLSGLPITPEDITMRGSTQPVKPTIKNWITIYQQEMGPAPHEPFERSNFLFHNPNALKLSKTDRDNLNSILKSLDEKTPLLIDILEQKILFSKTPSENSKDSTHKNLSEKDTSINSPSKESQEKNIPSSEKPQEEPSSQQQHPPSFAKNISFSSEHQFPNEEK